MDELKNRVWQICGYGWIDVMLSKINNVTLLPGNVFNNRNVNIIDNWLLIEIGQVGSMASVFPTAVYQNLTTAIEGFKYGNAVIGEGFAAPTNFSVNGSTITVDANTSQHAHKKDFPIALWHWNSATKVFTKSEITGSVSEGTVTFSAVPDGWHVAAVDDGGVYNSFCTPWKQVTS